MILQNGVIGDFTELMILWNGVFDDFAEWCYYAEA